jgi:uncharacterized membrane protein YhiD involved in acid resistance
MFVVISALAWAGIGVECVIDVLNEKGFAALCVMAVLAPTLAMIQWHAAQTQRSMQQVTKNHIEQLKEALDEHTRVLADHQSVVDALVGLWQRGGPLARFDAAEQFGMSADTGPFPAFRNGTLS